MKKTVLDYRYGHYALFGLTKHFMFVYNLKTENVSEYHLIKVDRELECNIADTGLCASMQMLTNSALSRRSAD